jgi:hypothetical protein
MTQMSKIVCIFFLIFSPNIAFGQRKIEKAMNELNQFNYFEAKKLFTKNMKKYESICCYGMARIFSKNDNPFYNLDSALIAIKRSESSYSIQKEKQKEKFKKLKFDYPTISNLRQVIASQIFTEALKQNTLSTYTVFVDNLSFANELPKAILLRDSIAFSNCVKSLKSEVFAQFMIDYPNSSFYENAKSEMQLLQYQEETKKGSVIEFVNFIKKHPENKYRGDAEDRIYDIVCEKNTGEVFQNFIQNYSINRNIDRAWRNFYKVSTADFSEKAITTFLENNTSYPFKNEIENDREMSKQQFLPLKKDNVWGFMDHQSKEVIAPHYDVVGFFNEGLAFAQKGRKFGYINKANETMIPFEYDNANDFIEGRALVEKNGKFGIIDRTGKLLLPIIFSDLGSFENGLVYGKIDSLYAYYDKYGFKRISERFEEAYDFENGKAIVTVKGKQGIIDEYGSYVVAPGVESIRIFNDSLYVVEDQEMFGIIRSNYSIVLPIMYDEIGSLENKRAIISKEDLFGFIDEKGAIVIPLKFENYPNYPKLAQFSNGLSKVKLKEKFGMIDLYGKIVIPTTFVALGQPGQLIACKKIDVWSYCDNKGIVQPKFNYETTESFSQGVGIVSSLTLYGLINTKSIFVLAPDYTEIKRLDSEFLMVRKGAKYGIVNNNGLIVVPIEYQKINTSKNDYFILQTQVKLITFTKKTNYLFQPNSNKLYF